MAALDGHHAPATRPTRSAARWARSSRALPEPVAAQAQAVRRTAPPRPDRVGRPARPGDHDPWSRPARDHRRVRLGYRSEAGPRVARPRSTRGPSWSATAGGTCSAGPHPRTPRAPTGSTGSRGVEPLDAGFDRRPGPGPGGRPRGAPRRRLGPPRRGRHRRPRRPRRRACPAPLGRLEAVDAETTRLTGSTSNPASYAEGLALLPVSFAWWPATRSRAAVRELGAPAARRRVRRPAGPLRRPRVMASASRRMARPRPAAPRHARRCAPASQTQQGRVRVAGVPLQQVASHLGGPPRLRGVV